MPPLRGSMQMVDLGNSPGADAPGYTMPPLPGLKTARSLRVGHHLQLEQAARLLLFEILAALLDVDVVPRQKLRQRSVALRVPRHVDAQVGERLPPELRLEALAPAVESGAAPPGLLQRRRHPPVAARQDALQQAHLDVV